MFALIARNLSGIRLKLKKPLGVLPYKGFIGMCGEKGRGFSDVLVRNRVRILGSGPQTPSQFFWEYVFWEKLPSTIYEKRLSKFLYIISVHQNN